MSFENDAFSTRARKNAGGSTLFAFAQAIFCASDLQQHLSQQRLADRQPQGEFSHGNRSISPDSFTSNRLVRTEAFGIGKPREIAVKKISRQHETQLDKRVRKKKHR